MRIGGNRVGAVESIDTVAAPPNSGCQAADGSSASTVAKLNLKLDKSADPLPADSTTRVRYRSSFGLKYLEITRGTSATGVPTGGTIPISQSQQQVEFDDVYNTFDTATRENSRRVLQGFGDAFAARGASLNEAIGALNPLFGNLRPVSKALADPSTQLVRFFPELADAARIVAPVAVDNAEQFTNGAIAFGAISSDPASAPGHDLGRPAGARGRASARCRFSSRSSPTSPISPGCCSPASATCGRLCRS